MSDDGGDDGESKKVRESSRGEKRGKKTTHFALVSSITSPSSQARSTGTVRLEEGEESAVASDRWWSACSCSWRRGEEKDRRRRKGRGRNNGGDGQGDGCGRGPELGETPVPAMLRRVVQRR